MDFAKELGGLMKICMVLGVLFVSRFGQANINSLLATEFYTWDIPKSFKNRLNKVKLE